MGLATLASASYMVGPAGPLGDARPTSKLTITHRRGSSLPSVGRVFQPSEVGARYVSAKCQPLVKGRGTWKLHRTQAGNGGYMEALDANCPVPKDQRPLQELNQLKEDFFLKWAFLPLPEYALRLLGT
eukprot:7139126-Pyramimonas_sp.AAC.1